LSEQRATKETPQRPEPFELSSGHAVAVTYSPQDLPDWEYLETLGYPGQYPFTRGIQATMYRGRLWTMRQYAGFGDAEESNRRYLFLLSQGQPPANAHVPTLELHIALLRDQALHGRSDEPIFHRPKFGRFLHRSRVRTMSFR